MAEGGEPLSMSASDSSVSKQVGDCQEEKVEMDAIDVLLQRTKSERMQELAQIQNHNRPVTGTNSGEQINQFFHKNLEAREQAHAAQASGKENVPLNSPNVEEHRPEAVVIEIQGLSQQHRVSSVLQTAAFRRHLESIIRGSINTVARNHSPVSSVSQSPASSHQPSPSPAQRLSPIREQQTPAAAQTMAPEVQQERADSMSSGSSSSSSSVDYNTRIQDPRGLLGSVLNNSTSPPPAPPMPPTLSNNQNIEVGWASVEEMQHEDLIQEVSELVHRRLVSSTLEGEFRNVLEFHIRERVQASGTDGQRVQEFIRSIPQSQPHVQNDFSNLGIPPPNENWDNVSVTSISATAVPYTQTNLHLSREIAALKAQMQEMRNMMKVSFDLQLDIQRAIRQEVAAGIAAATGGNTVGNSSEPKTASAPKSRPVSEAHCLICLDNFSDSVLYQCGHMCVCYPCGRHLMDRGSKCPLCRAPIRDIIRAYKCNQD